MRHISEHAIRHWRLIVFTVGLVLLFWLLWVLRSALFPFIFGLLLAYIFLPFILWVERRLPKRGRWLQTKRVSLILLVYIIILAVLGGLAFYITFTIINSFQDILTNASQYSSDALSRIQAWLNELLGQLPSSIQGEADQFVQDLGTTMGNAVRGIFMRGISLIPTTIGFILGLASLPLFLFYLLKDWSKVSNGLYTSLPDWASSHTRNILRIVERVLGRYIRAQILLGIIVGVLVFIGLLILRMPFAPVLAVLAAGTEVIPILGPWIGGITAVILTLAVAPDKVLWVAVLFAAVQILENALLVPRIQSAFLNIHPTLVIFLLVIGAYIFGFWGLVLAVPLASTIVQIYKYLIGAAREEDSHHPNMLRTP